MVVFIGCVIVSVIGLVKVVFNLLSNRLSIRIRCRSRLLVVMGVILLLMW